MPEATSGASRIKAVTLVNRSGTSARQCVVWFAAGAGRIHRVDRARIDGPPGAEPLGTPHRERVLGIDGRFRPGEEVVLIVHYTGSPPSPVRVDWHPVGQRLDDLVPAGLRELGIAGEAFESMTLDVSPGPAAARAMFQAVEREMEPEARGTSIRRMKSVLHARVDKRWIVHRDEGRAALPLELVPISGDWIEELAPILEGPFAALQGATLAQAFEWFAQGRFARGAGGHGQPDSAHFCFFAEFALAALDAGCASWPEYAPAIVRSVGIYFDHYGCGDGRSVRCPPEMSFADYGPGPRPDPRRRSHPSLEGRGSAELALHFAAELRRACPAGVLVHPRVDLPAPS